MAEELADQLARVHMMADADGDWDLSPNDRAALVSVLREFGRANAKYEQARDLLEEAMHCLLHVDAHMLTERVPVAEKIAKMIGHPWPPYPDAKDEDDESDTTEIA